MLRTLGPCLVGGIAPLPTERLTSHTQILPAFIYNATDVSPRGARKEAMTVNSQAKVAERS